MTDEETFKPQLELSIVGETDPVFTEVFTVEWCSDRAENDEGELQTVIDEEDQLFLESHGHEKLQNLVDSYTRYLADIRYDRLPAEEEAPAE